MAIQALAGVSRVHSPIRRDGANDAPAVAADAATVSKHASGILAIRQVLSNEAKLPIQKGSESRLMVHDAPTGKGTIVMLHGFSAGTWQFEDLAKAYFDDGYDVYLPRLAGHGFKNADGSEDATHLLNSQSHKDYHQYAEDVYKQAAGLGGPLRLMGLSGGANVALDIAEHHPDVKGAVLFAPFLAPKSGLARFGFGVARVVDWLTNGLAGKGLDRLAFGWGEDGRAAAKAWGRPGHWDMKLGNVYGLANYGNTLIRDATACKVPLQLITSEIDDAADSGAIKRVFERAGGAKRNGLYTFAAGDKIPHPMVHPRENDAPNGVAAVARLARDFIAKGEASNRE